MLSPLGFMGIQASRAWTVESSPPPPHLAFDASPAEGHLPEENWQDGACPGYQENARGY